MNGRILTIDNESLVDCAKNHAIYHKSGSTRIERSYIYGGIYQIGGTIYCFGPTDINTIGDYTGEFYNIAKLAMEDQSQYTGYAYVAILGKSSELLRFVAKDGVTINGRTVEVELDPETGLPKEDVKQPNPIVVGFADQQEKAQDSIIKIINNVSYDLLIYEDMATLARKDSIEFPEQKAKSNLHMSINLIKAYPLVEE